MCGCFEMIFTPWGIFNTTVLNKGVISSVVVVVVVLFDNLSFYYLRRTAVLLEVTGVLM